MKDEMFPKLKKVESPVSLPQVKIEQGWLTKAITEHGFDPTLEVAKQQRAARQLAENIERGRQTFDRRMASLVRGMLEPGVSRTRSLQDAFGVPAQERTTEEAWAKAVAPNTDAAHAARLGASKPYGEHGTDL